MLKFLQRRLFLLGPWVWVGARVEGVSCQSAGVRRHRRSTTYPLHAIELEC